MRAPNLKFGENAPLGVQINCQNRQGEQKHCVATLICFDPITV